MDKYLQSTTDICTRVIHTYLLVLTHTIQLRAILCFLVFSVCIIDEKTGVNLYRNPIYALGIQLLESLHESLSLIICRKNKKQDRKVEPGYLTDLPEDVQSSMTPKFHWLSKPLLRCPLHCDTLREWSNWNLRIAEFLYRVSSFPSERTRIYRAKERFCERETKRLFEWPSSLENNKYRPCNPGILFSACSCFHANTPKDFPTWLSLEVQCTEDRAQRLSEWW